MSLVPHGLLAQVQQICQCFTETPRGHKRDRSRTPDSSHRVLWHLEGKVKRSRVCFFRVVFGCRRFRQRAVTVGLLSGRPVGTWGTSGSEPEVKPRGSEMKTGALTFLVLSFAPRSEALVFTFGVNSQKVDFVVYSCLAPFCLKRLSLK